MRKFRKYNLLITEFIVYIELQKIAKNKCNACLFKYILLNNSFSIGKSFFM